jgi:hypothetical protein
MRKMILLVLPVVTVLSGCYDTLNSQGVGAGYEPGAATMAPSPESGKPRPYSVTAQDQVKYDELTKKIQNRQQARNNVPAVPPNKSSNEQTATS